MTRTRTDSEAARRQLARDQRALRLERKRQAKVEARSPGASGSGRLSSPALTRWQAEAEAGLLDYLEGEVS